jgi:hypothetical protein
MKNKKMYLIYASNFGAFTIGCCFVAVFTGITGDAMIPGIAGGAVGIIGMLGCTLMFRNAESEENKKIMEA